MLWFGKLDLYETWEPKRSLAEIIRLPSPYVNSPSPTAPWSLCMSHMNHACTMNSTPFHTEISARQRHSGRVFNIGCINIIHHLSLLLNVYEYVHCILDSTIHIEFTVLIRLSI